MSKDSLGAKIAYGLSAGLLLGFFGWACWISNYVVGLEQSKIDRSEKSSLPYPYLEDKSKVQSMEREIEHIREKVDGSLEGLVQKAILTVTRLEERVAVGQEVDKRMEQALNRLTDKLDKLEHPDTL